MGRMSKRLCYNILHYDWKPPGLQHTALCQEAAREGEPTQKTLKMAQRSHVGVRKSKEKA